MFYATIIIFFLYYIKILASCFFRTLCSTVDSLKGILALCQPHHYSLVSIATGTQPSPKRVLHTVRSSASSSNFQYYVLSLMSTSICLRLLFININQLDELNFIISLFQASTCFEHMCSSSGGQKFYYTLSGIITPIGVMIPETA